MEIPFFYELVWIASPILYLVLLAVVLLKERQRDSSWQRVTIWAAIQIVFPIIGFVAWLIFRSYEKQGAEDTSS